MTTAHGGLPGTLARAAIAVIAAGLIVALGRPAWADDEADEPELEVDDILADDEATAGPDADASADTTDETPADATGEAAAAVADEAAATAPETPQAKQKTVPPPKRIAVKVFAVDQMVEATRAALERAIAAGASETGASEMVTNAGKDQSDAQIDAALEKADEARQKALQLIDDLEFEAATKPLEAAAEQYGRYLSELMLRDGNASKLVDVYIKQVIVSYLAGDEETASRALSHAFILDPTIQFDTKRFPPQLEEFVVQERLLFDELGTGTLSISSEGGLAMVLINGIERGPAPVKAEKLPAGPNLVTLRVFGAPPIAAIGLVKGEATTSLAVALDLPPSRDSGPLAKARREVGKSSAGRRLDKAAGKLDVDGLLLVVPTVDGGKIQLVAYLYDMRSGTLVNRVETSIEPGSGETEASALGGAALRGAVWPAAVEIATSKRRPIWKHKYFWPVVGVTAGVIVLGVIISASQGLSPGQKIGLFPTVRF